MKILRRDDGKAPKRNSKCTYGCFRNQLLAFLRQKCRLPFHLLHDTVEKKNHYKVQVLIKDALTYAY